MSKSNLRKPRLTEEQRKEFTESADFTSQSPGAQAKKTKPKLADEEKRTYKAVNVGMNKSEWDILQKAREESGLSDVAFLRTAMLKMAKKILN